MVWTPLMLRALNNSGANGYTAEESALLSRNLLKGWCLGHIWSKGPFCAFLSFEARLFAQRVGGPLSWSETASFPHSRLR